MKLRTGPAFKGADPWQGPGSPKLASHDTLGFFKAYNTGDVVRMDLRAVFAGKIAGHTTLHRREVISINSPRLHALPVLVAQTSSPTRALLALMFSRLAAITLPALANATSVPRRSLVRSAPGPSALFLVPSHLAAFHVLDPTCTFARAGCGSCVLHIFIATVVVFLWVLREWRSKLQGRHGFCGYPRAERARAP